MSAPRSSSMRAMRPWPSRRNTSKNDDMRIVWAVLAKRKPPGWRNRGVILVYLLGDISSRGTNLFLQGDGSAGNQSNNSQSSSYANYIVSAGAGVGGGAGVGVAVAVSSPLTSTM